MGVRDSTGKKQKRKGEDHKVDKLKKQFIPIDYQLDLFKKMQGLKQAGKYVLEYTKEFYRVLIRTGYVEANNEKGS